MQAFQIISNSELDSEVSLFEQLTLTTQSLAYRIAYRLLRSEDAAADAVQESLIKAYRSFATFRGGSLKNWYLRILTNTCYDLLRIHKRRATTSIDDLLVEAEAFSPLSSHLEQPEEYVERMDLCHWLERGLTSLPVEQRMVVILYDVEGYSYSEIAEITGVSIGTVKSRLSRGRVRLRDFLVRQRVLSVQ